MHKNCIRSTTFLYFDVNCQLSAPIAKFLFILYYMVNLLFMDILLNHRIKFSIPCCIPLGLSDPTRCLILLGKRKHECLEATSHTTTPFHNMFYTKNKIRMIRAVKNCLLYLSKVLYWFLLPTRIERLLDFTFILTFAKRNSRMCRSVYVDIILNILNYSPKFF